MRAIMGENLEPQSADAASKDAAKIGLTADAKGQVCRHIVVWLTAGSRTKKTETIACRQADRVWAFEG